MTEAITICIELSLLILYASGQEYQLVPSNGPKEGHITITVISNQSRFETKDNTTAVQIGHTVCQTSLWISETVIMCRLSAGITADAEFKMTVGATSLGNTYSVTLDGGELHFSYDTAEIDSVYLNRTSKNTTASNLARVPNQVLMLQGHDFGTYDSTVRSRVGQTSCEFTLWASDSACYCKMISSTQQQFQLFLTISNKTSSTCPSQYDSTGQFILDSANVTLEPNSTVVKCQDAIRLDPFELAASIPRNGGSSGGWMLTITGVGFGIVDSTVRVRLLPENGDEVLAISCDGSQWNSDSSIFCLMPRGDANNFALAVTVDQLEQVSKSRVTYDDFSLVDYVPHHADNAGNIRLEISGTSFGYSPDKRRAVRLGDTACIETVWFSDTSLSCMVPPGYGIDLSLAISVNSPADPHIIQDDGDPSLYFSYDSPLISQIAYPNAPANGGTIITVSGSAFGAWDLSPQTFIGDTICLKTEWISSSSLKAKVAARAYDRIFRGSSHDVQVLVGPLSDTAVEAFTYDAACNPAPCVVLVACRHGCDQSNTQGDYRHSKNVHKEFTGVSVARIIGDFTLGGYRNVTVGNTTDNTTVPVLEEPCYDTPCQQLTNVNTGVFVVFGNLFTCEFLIGSDYDMQSFFDCVMPAGVGAGHLIQVSLRNATSIALLAGCTADMKKSGNNCHLPANNTVFFNLTNVTDVFFDYSRPTILSLEPSTGLNVLGKTANVTIVGSGFGRAAVEQWQSVCLNSNITVCRQLFSSSVIVFNTSCTQVDLLLRNAKLGSDVQATARANTLAYCRDAGAIALICSNAFAISSLCVRGCSQSWNSACDPVCPEDKIICNMPVIGGVQRLTVVVGGVPSPPTPYSTFIYIAPDVTFVLPPELEMGKSSLVGIHSFDLFLCTANSRSLWQLTVIGTNFGIPIAVAYAGRDPPVKYDSGLFAPYNDSSLAWWDVAQYLTCFSGVLNSSNESIVPPSLRQCDLGVTLSNQIQFYNSWDQDPTKQQLVVQSPQVQVGAANVETVDIFVQSIGIRSKVTPIYAQIAFRRACESIRHNLGDMTSLWYLGAGDTVIMTDLTDGRQDFAAVPFQNQIFILGGRSRTTTQRAETYYSASNGVTGWQLLSPPEYLARWSARVNLTAVVFQDEMFVLGGRTTDGRTCYNDVWVFIQDKTREAFWQVKGGPIQYDLYGTGFQSYFLQITANAPWSARSNLQGLIFQNQFWVLGGVACGTELWQPDLWKTSDMRTWELVNANNVWFGRNSIFAAVFDSKMWVVASVQQQFYNTFYSSDGETWLSPPDSCALTNVDVNAIIATDTYIMLFTLGCHNLGSDGEEETSCPSGANNTKIRMQNRIYYTKTGVLWYLARNPYTLDVNSKRPLSRALPWQSRNDDVPSGQEFRWGYSVVLYNGVMYLIGGKQRSPYRDPTTGQFILGNALQEKYRMDIWLSDGLISIFDTCMDQSSSGLTTSLIAQFQSGSVKCEGLYPSTYDEVHDT